MPKKKKSKASKTVGTQIGSNSGRLGAASGQVKRKARKARKRSAY